jgi:putative mRNA 3-end processing factor
MFDVDVLANGAVVLSPDVVCDGFVHGMPVRAQTHVHDDHMEDFDTSKGFQSLVMTEPTRDLLVAERDADLPYRNNIIALNDETAYEVNQSRVLLRPSDHMLGSCQVMVERADGLRVGYSGDFQWPMRRPIEVDVLVVDSTYGSPDSIRNYQHDTACDSPAGLRGPSAGSVQPTPMRRG